MWVRLGSWGLLCKRFLKQALSNSIQEITCLKVFWKWSPMDAVHPYPTMCQAVLRLLLRKLWMQELGFCRSWSRFKRFSKWAPGLLFCLLHEFDSLIQFFEIFLLMASFMCHSNWLWESCIAAVLARKLCSSFEKCWFLGLLQNFDWRSCTCADVNSFSNHIRDGCGYLEQHICTWAIFSQNMKRKIETHHYAACLNDDFLQCAVYDSDQANARLIGNNFNSYFPKQLSIHTIFSKFPSFPVVRLGPLHWIQRSVSLNNSYWFEDSSLLGMLVNLFLACVH